VTRRDPLILTQSPYVAPKFRQQVVSVSRDRHFSPKYLILTLSLRENHTPAALARQVQIDTAALGPHRAPFGSLVDLFGLFLASNLPGR
jgi:hypothetical protein